MIIYSSHVLKLKSVLFCINFGNRPSLILSRNCAFEREQYGVGEAGVLFHEITAPSHGRLEVAKWRGPEHNLFSLQDLNKNLVTYVHDGIEATEDSIVLELELVTRSGYILPSYLQVSPWAEFRKNYYTKVSDYKVAPWWLVGFCP